MRVALNFRWRVSRYALLAFAAIYSFPLLCSQSEAGNLLETRYLTISILRDWIVERSSDQTLNLRPGKYVLSIDPIFMHASPVEGGRFSEIVSGMRSVDAVMRNVDQPAVGAECSQLVTSEVWITKTLSLGSLYTDSSKTGSGCVFPSSGQPVWFGSFFRGEGPESEYKITMFYDSDNVDALPRKGSAELKQVFAQVTTMLKTLHLKTLVLISRIDPPAALPGATARIYGSGFDLYKMIVRLSTADTSYMPDPVAAPDGKSLTFQVPTSTEIVSCPEGRVEIDGGCLPIPPGHIDVNDCPRLSGASIATFCGVPVLPGPCQLSVNTDNSALSIDPLPFRIIAPKPAPVSISLLYPNQFVSPGDTITVRGTGFTATGNKVRIGASVVENISSPDGHSITFAAPEPSGTSSLPVLKIYDASVSNASGESNSIIFGYR